MTFRVTLCGSTTLSSREIVTLAYKLKNCSQERFSSWLCDFLFSLTMEYFFGAQICEAKALCIKQSLVLLWIDVVDKKYISNTIKIRSLE